MDIKSNWGGIEFVRVPAGQFLKWCHSLYQPYPYKADNSHENENASGNRVLRGGSYLRHQMLARCACRIDLRFANILRGFRVAVAPPIPAIIKF